MDQNLDSFFSIIGEEKKKKEEEQKEIIGEISLESMFQDIAVETARVKKELQEKEKEKEEARKRLVADAKIFENFIFSEPKKKTKKKAKKDVYEEIKQEIGSKDKPVKPAVDEIATEETTAEHAIKILDTINEKTGKEIIKENTTESEIAILRKELDVLKNIIHTQGGGGEVRLEFLDDVDRDSAKVNDKVLKYQSSTGKWVGGAAAGIGTEDSVNTTGIITASAFVGPLTGNVDGTTGTFSGNISAVNATFSGDVSVGGTLTYEDVTSIDSVGLITARSGIDLGGSNIVRIEGVTSTKTSTAQASIDTFSSSTYSAATYQVQIKKGSDYHTTSINLLHAGGNVYISEYGTIKTGISLATFDADINSGNVRLLATPTSSDSTVFKVFRTTMNA